VRRNYQGMKEQYEVHHERTDVTREIPNEGAKDEVPEVKIIVNRFPHEK
jgi:hypothetical protein